MSRGYTDERDADVLALANGDSGDLGVLAGIAGQAEWLGRTQWVSSSTARSMGLMSARSAAGRVVRQGIDDVGNGVGRFLPDGGKMPAQADEYGPAEPVLVADVDACQIGRQVGARLTGAADGCRRLARP